MSALLTNSAAVTILGNARPFTGPTISAATNASPSVCTAAALTTPLQVGEVLLITGVTGNTSLNGLRIVATTPSPTTFTLNDFVAGTEIDGNGTTGGTIVATRVLSAIRPGDLGDLQVTLSGHTCALGPFSDANRSAEGTVKTILGI